MSKRIVFSEVHGTVLREGMPVAGARVARRYKWGEKSGEDAAETDANGAFHLPEMLGKTLFGFLPGETVIEQTIEIEHESQTFEAWIAFKRNYERNGELNGTPLRLRCELSRPPARTDVGPSGPGFFGICTLE